MEIKQIPLTLLHNNTGQIKDLPSNPRYIREDQYKKLLTSIKDDPEMLNLREILAYDNFGELVVIAGNMRLRACIEAGMTEVPVKILPSNTPVDKLKRYVIKDNIPYGENDWDKLANEWEQEKLEEWGLDTPDDWAEDESEIEEDEAPEVDETQPAKSELGKVYQLGRHRLMCGDATKIEDVERLMNGQKADMVFTDPPYGIDLDTDYSNMPSIKEEGNRTYSPVIGDDKPFNHQDFHWIDCKEQIWFGANYYAKTLPDGGSWLVWDKRVEEKFDRMFGSGFEIAWSKTPHKQKIYRHNNTLFGGDSEAIGKEHPTQKPTKLCSEIIKDFGNDSDKVLDLFGGSGSTLIACEQTNRSCYMMELDPKYVDVIRKRYAKFVYPNRWEKEWESLTPSIM